MRLDEKDPHDSAQDWLTQLRLWVGEAEAAGVTEPGAMVLATASAEGAPGARHVLLRGLDERGLAFFTNYGSRKARELDANPRAAAVLHWREPAHRQVIVDGSVERLSAAESDEYFVSRPYGSRIGALASRQSSVIASRVELEARYAELEARYSEDNPPPRPEWWGGYLLKPAAVEFWEGRPNRLHDRLRFRKTDDEWILERLAP